MMIRVTAPFLPDADLRTAHPEPAPATLRGPDGRDLPLRSTQIEAEAAGGLSRIVLTQTYVNDTRAPLRVTYDVPLPADAAVAGYWLEVAGERVQGQVRTREDARRAFEDAVAQGRSAALLDEERSTRFRQELGNVPAGEAVTVALTINARLAWRAAAREWEWRFPTVVAPRYERSGTAGERAGTTTGEVSARAKFTLSVDDAVEADPESPSHAIAIGASDDRSIVGCAAEDGARLDRDIVVRWRPVALQLGVRLHVERPAASHARGESAFGLLTLVPPQDTVGSAVSRDLIVLLDTSGSMGGAPLAQSVAVTKALIATLGERDRLELVEFSMAPRRWRKGATHATPRAKKNALKWLDGLRAGGGTEMRDGILAALAPLDGESMRQVVLISDGLIGFEDEIVSEVRDRLPAGSRVHTVGVGHGVNRSLTRAVARAGRGVECIVAPEEDAERAARELVNATDAPLAVDLAIEGDALRSTASAPRDLYAGAPSLVPVELDPRGGCVTIHGRTAEGAWHYEVAVPAAPDPIGDGMRATLYARERVDDLEIMGACDRSREDIDTEIERLGLDFSIATRRTSWVVVTEARTVDPKEPTRVVHMPHELAAGMSAESIGLRAPIAQDLDETSMTMMRPLAAAPIVDACVELAKVESAEMAPGSPAEVGDLDDEFKERAQITPRRPAKRRSIVDRVLGRPEAVRGGGGPSGPERRVLVAQIRSLDGGKVVLEIVVRDTVVWRFDREVLVEFDDGSKQRVRVDADRSTAPGAIAPGMTIRLVLEGAPSGRRPVRVITSEPGGPELQVRP